MLALTLEEWMKRTEEGKIKFSRRCLYLLGSCVRFLRLWSLEEDVPCGKAHQACSTLMIRSFDGRVPSTIYRGSLEAGDSGSMAVVAGVRLIHDAKRQPLILLRRGMREWETITDPILIVVHTWKLCRA